MVPRFKPGDLVFRKECVDPGSARADPAASNICIVLTCRQSHVSLNYMYVQLLLPWCEVVVREINNNASKSDWIKVDL